MIFNIHEYGQKIYSFMLQRALASSPHIATEIKEMKKTLSLVTANGLN